MSKLASALPSLFGVTPGDCICVTILLATVAPLHGDGVARDRLRWARHHTDMSFRSQVARALAHAFVIGPWEAAELRQLGAQVLGARHRWLAPLVRTVIESFSAHPEGDEGVSRVAALIESEPSFRAAFYSAEVPRSRRWLSRPAAMGSMPWPVPPASNVAELAQLLEPSRESSRGSPTNGAICDAAHRRGSDTITALGCTSRTVAAA